MAGHQAGSVAALAASSSVLSYRLVFTSGVATRSLTTLHFNPQHYNIPPHSGYHVQEWIIARSVRIVYTCRFWSPEFKGREQRSVAVTDRLARVASVLWSCPHSCVTPLHRAQSVRLITAPRSIVSVCLSAVKILILYLFRRLITLRKSQLLIHF
jgi:hypothetical protein